MTEMNSELSGRPLVVGQNLDGRRRYDADVKRALIESALVPGVSVARLAMENGLNANLLRTWIAKYKKHSHAAPAVLPTVVAVTRSAFVPVVRKHAPSRPSPSLHARLHNGVEISLELSEGDALVCLLQALNDLPCSASPKG